MSSRSSLRATAITGPSAVRTSGSRYEYLNTGRCLCFPSRQAYKRFLVGRDFDGTDASGTLHSVVRVTEDNRINGIHYFLRRSGAEEDDIVLLRFDLAQNAVVVSIIDDDALEELNPET